MTNDRINILYLSSFGSLKWGGQKSLYYLVSNLDKTTFRPCVVVPTDEDLAHTLREDNIDVFIQKLPKVTFPALLVATKAAYCLSKLMDKYKIDIIHTDGPRNTFYAGLVARIKRIPLVWHIRVSDHDRFDRVLAFIPKKIILVADALRKRFPGVTCDDRFVTIYNGVDPTKFNNDGPASSFKKSLGIEENTLLVSVFARVESLKGQKYLIEACGRILSRLPQFHLLFMGEITEPAYQSECKHLAAKWHIQDQVTFAGHRTEVVEIFRATDIVVLPSLTEAFPRVLIEGMAAAKPVIATAVGGVPEAVEDGISGFLVAPGDSLSLAEKIGLLAVNRDLRMAMGKAARKRVEALFSIEGNVRKTEQVYHELLGR
jgi:glycosyltransferase involved in cell wall biosynthesis